MRFGEYLQQKGIVTESQIREYIRETKADASEIGKLLSQEEADKLIRELTGG